MGYIEKALAPGEKVILRAKVHWMDWMTGGGLGWLLPIIPDVEAAIRWFTTELALTDRRLIGKTRTLSRRITLDVPLERIQEISVRHGLLGKRFSYGELTIETDEQTVTFKGIAHSDAFRAAVLQEVKAHRQP